MNCCCVFVQRIGWIKSDIVFEFNNGTICICSIHLEVAQNFYACFILSFHFVVCSKIKYFSNLWWTIKKDWITRYFGEHFFSVRNHRIRYSMILYTELPLVQFLTSILFTVVAALANNFQYCSWFARGWNTKSISSHLWGHTYGPILDGISMRGL